MKKSVLIVLLFLVLSSTLVFAESLSEEPNYLRVATKNAPPFVMIDNEGEVSGFSIDLITAIVKNIDPSLHINFIVDKGVPEHLDTVRDRNADFGIAATTITSEREEGLDFSQPFFHAPLGIMTRSVEKTSIMSVLFSQRALSVLFIIIGFVIVCAHIMWFVERGRGQKTAFSDKYPIGIWQSIWWTIVTMSTVGYGDYAPKKWTGRLVGIVIIFSGISIFGVAVAFLSSALTITSLPVEPISLNDLTGRTVGVIQGTVGADITQTLPVQVEGFETLEGAMLALEQKKVYAVIHDTPLLQHFSSGNPDMHITLSSETFAPRSYGIIFPEDSTWYDPINQELLKMIEDERSEYYFFQKKWFGIDQ